MVQGGGKFLKNSIKIFRRRCRKIYLIRRRNLSFLKIPKAVGEIEIRLQFTEGVERRSHVTVFKHAVRRNLVVYKVDRCKSNISKLL